MKVYVHESRFYVPGSQPKGAFRREVPTDSQGLVDYLNGLVGQKTNGDEPVQEAPVVRHVEHGPVALLTGIAEVPQAPARITDEAFEALPLAYQLHLATLALENARNANLLGTAPAKAPQRYEK